MTKEKSLKLRELPEHEREIIKRERERTDALPPIWKQPQKGWDG